MRDKAAKADPFFEEVKAGSGEGARAKVELERRAGRQGRAAERPRELEYAP